MAHKIIVADDSPTIQKVVRITLGGEPYDIIECQSEEELYTQIKDPEVKLVLLDFNLSQRNSGYEIAVKLKEAHSAIKVMAMLGTFDSVNDKAMKNAGIDDSIVKPFESAKFIQKCIDLIENENESDSELLEGTPQDDEVFEEEKPTEDEEWVVNAPPMEDFESPADTVANSLKDEIGNWGIDIPGVIGMSQGIVSVNEIPGVIGEENSEETSASNDPLPSSDSTIVPRQEDLEYPEIISPVELERLQAPTSKLIPVDELAPCDQVDVDDDTTEAAFIVPSEIKDNLEDEIKDEASPDDFWAVDETATLDNDVETKADDSYEDYKLDILQEKTPAVESTPMFESSAPMTGEDIDFVEKVEDRAEVFNEDEIVEKLKQAMTPILEDIVKKYCKETVERVAWDLMPDLAENLIKKELQDISKSI